MISSRMAVRPMSATVSVGGGLRHQSLFNAARPLSTSSSAGPSRIRLEAISWPTIRPSVISHAHVKKASRIYTSRQLSTLPPLATTSSQLESTSATSQMTFLADPSSSSSIPDSALLDSAPDPSFLDPLINPLADLLLSLPHPLGYGGSIILLTLLVRTAVTLPVTLWQRKRALKARRLVEPEMKIINERLAKEIAADSRKKGFSYNQYLAELRRQLANAQSALHKQHRTHPFITTWAPLGVHLPIFITVSLMIRRALDMPDSPLAADSFLWLEKLGDVDNQWILPLVGMAVAFGNAEMVGKRSKEVREAFNPTTGAVAGSSATVSASGAAEGQSDQKPTPAKPLIPLKQSRPPQPPRSDGQSTGLFASRTAATPPNSSSSSSSTAPGPSRLRRMSTTSSAALAPHPSRNPKPSKPNASNSVKPKAQLVEVGTQNKPPSFSPARQAELRRAFFAAMLRFSALGFGMIASQMPSGLVLYWFTSLSYSFIQNAVLSWWPQGGKEGTSAVSAIATEKSN